MNKKLVKPLGYFVKGIYFVISALLLYQRKVYHTYYIMVLPTMQNIWGNWGIYLFIHCWHLFIS